MIVAVIALSIQKFCAQFYLLYMIYFITYNANESVWLGWVLYFRVF